MEANSIDTLIKESLGTGTTAIKAPATMALSGVFTNRNSRWFCVR